LLGDDRKPAADSGRSILTSGLSTVASSTLQIKGIVADTGELSTNSGIAQALDVLGEESTNAQPANAVAPESDPTGTTAVLGGTIAPGGPKNPSIGVTSDHVAGAPTKGCLDLSGSLITGRRNPTVKLQDLKTAIFSRNGKNIPTTVKAELPSVIGSTSQSSGADVTGGIAPAAPGNLEAAVAAVIILGSDASGRQNAMPNLVSSAADGTIASVVEAVPAVATSILSTLADVANLADANPAVVAPTATVIPVDGSIASTVVADVFSPAVPIAGVMPADATHTPASSPVGNQTDQNNTTTSSVESATGATASPDVITIPTMPPEISSTPVGGAIASVVSADVTMPAEQAANPTLTAAATHSPHVIAQRPQVMLNQVAGTAIAPPDSFASAVDKAQGTGDVLPSPAEQSATPTVTPELRREVVETIAAMLTPFLMSLPALAPQSLPATTGGVPASDATAPASGQISPSPVMTIKIGSQPPVSFDLMSSAASSSVENLSSNSQNGQEADAVTVADLASTRSQLQDSMLSPTAASALVDHLPLDFRIQLKTKIETAWKQADQANANVAVAPEALPVSSDPQPLLSLSSPQPASGQMGSIAAPETPSSTASDKSNEDLTVQEAIRPVPATTANAASAAPATAVEVMVELPGIGSLTAQIMSSNLASTPLEKKSGRRSGQAEKTAGDLTSIGTTGRIKNNLPEKTFLTVGGESLKSNDESAGTDVANSGDSMPAIFTSRRVTVDPLELPPKVTGRDFLPSFNESPNLTVSNDVPTPATPPPVLAHRAVETILNVVEAQRNGSANASSVNLHFKFGGDDLAVRVQMRGNEVLTQFLTDSSDLRSAINSEWQRMAGQGGVAGLRLLEPVVMPSSAGVSTGFGSASQGQNQAQQNAQQQQAQAAEGLPDLRSLRRSATVPTTSPAEIPGNLSEQADSHLLTALA
jgi:hypothetical protein